MNIIVSKHHKYIKNKTSDLVHQRKTETSTTQQAASSFWSNTTVLWFSPSTMPSVSNERRNIREQKKQLPYSPSDSSGPSLSPAVRSCQEGKTKTISLWPSFEQDWRLQVGQTGRSTHMLLTRRRSRSSVWVAAPIQHPSRSCIIVSPAGVDFGWKKPVCSCVSLLHSLTIISTAKSPNLGNILCKNSFNLGNTPVHAQVYAQAI